MKVLVPARYGCGLSVVTGSYLPERVVYNDEIVSRGAPLTAEEIVKLTGIEQRRYADPGQATSHLAVAAGRDALERSAVQPAAVDRLVLATTSPDHPVPSTACAVQHALGMRRVPAFDVSAACSGFVYALDLAARSILTGDDVVLALAAEIRSRVIDPRDRSTAALFGDGAAGAVVQRGPVGRGLLAIGLTADGSGARTVHIPAGGSAEPASRDTVDARRHFLHMRDGPQVYFSAVEGMIETGRLLLDELGLSWQDLDMVVPHQPNARLLERMARVAGVARDRVYVNVARFGNTSGAASGIALHEAEQTGRVGPGSRVLLLTAGAGYTSGAALLQY